MNQLGKMTDFEKQILLAKLEKTAVDSNKSFFARGKALQEIDSKKLYWPRFRFLSPYLKDINLDHSRGWRLIYFTEVVENLKDAGFLILPISTEVTTFIHSLRSLDDRIQVWKESITLAGDILPSALIIQEILKDHPEMERIRTQKEECKIVVSKKKCPPMNDAHKHFIYVIDELIQIEHNDIGRKQVWADLRKWLDEHE